MIFVTTLFDRDFDIGCREVSLVQLVKALYENFYLNDDKGVICQSFVHAETKLPLLKSECSDKE